MALASATSIPYISNLAHGVTLGDKNDGSRMPYTWKIDRIKWNFSPTTVPLGDSVVLVE